MLATEIEEVFKTYTLPLRGDDVLKSKKLGVVRGLRCV